MTAAVSAAASAACLIHTGGGGKPNVEDVSSALRALGFRNPRDTASRHGVADCSAAILYVAAQRGPYAARNPGGLVRWLLANKDGLSGWQASRLRGFLVRFRSLPEWVRERIARWLGLSSPPESPRVRPPAQAQDRAPSSYPTWEEVQAAKARDERLFAQMVARQGIR